MPVLDDPAEEFCRLACLTYGREDGPARWAQARHLLTRYPAPATAARGRPGSRT